MTRHRYRRRFRLGSLYVWHRYIGIMAALFVVLLSITGIMLNHTDELGLDSSYIDSNRILDWYGIDLPDKHTSFSHKNFRVTLLGHQLYLNYKKVKGEYSSLAGLVVSEGVLVVAVNNGLLLLTDQGEVIENLDTTHGLPAGTKGVGLDQGNGIVVRTSSGDYLADKTLIKWQGLVGKKDVGWSVPSVIPEDLFSEISRDYRGHDLSVERVVLDLHSGRILGEWGPTIMDAAGTIMVLLSISGLWLWVKGIIHRRNHRRKKGHRA